MLLIPLLVYVFVPTGLLLSLTIAICLLLGLLHGAMAWMAWRNSVLLLTDQRVILIEQKNLLHREFAECGLENIQQVSHQVKGLLRTMFSFGDIAIFTAGSREPFLLPSVPHPYEIQTEIQRTTVGEGS